MRKNLLAVAAAALVLVASLPGCSTRGDHQVEQKGPASYSDRTWGDGTYELVDPDSYDGGTDQMPRTDLFVAPATPDVTCKWHTGVNPLGTHKVRRAQPLKLSDGNAERIVLDGCMVTASQPGDGKG